MERSLACPCVVQRLQKSTGLAEARRDAFPWQGARGREPSRRELERARAGEKAQGTTGLEAAKPRGRSRSEPGARKSVAGRRSLIDGRYLGPQPGAYRSRGREEGGLGGSGMLPSARARRDMKEARQGCQRLWSAHAATGRQRPGQHVQPAEVNRPRVNGRSPARRARKRATDRETDEARVLVRRSEMAEVGPTHPAS